MRRIRSKQGAGAAVTLVAGLALVLFGAGGASAQSAATFAISPTSGPPGVVVGASGITPCPAVPASAVNNADYAGAFVEVDIISADGQFGFGDFTDMPDTGGPWTFPVDSTGETLPPGAYTASADCGYTIGETDTSYLSYVDVPFQVCAAGTASCGAAATTTTTAAPTTTTGVTTTTVRATTTTRASAALPATGRDLDLASAAGAVMLALGLVLLGQAKLSDTRR